MQSAGNSQPKNNAFRMKVNVNSISPPILDENQYVWKKLIFQVVKNSDTKFQIKIWNKMAKFA